MSSNDNTRPNNIRSQESSLHNSLLVASPIKFMASNSSIVCRKCHHKGHIASHCPQRALPLDVEHSSLEDEEHQIVDPLDYFGDEILFMKIVMMKRVLVSLDVFYPQL